MNNPNRDRLSKSLDGLSPPVNPMAYNEKQLSHWWLSDSIGLALIRFKSRERLGKPRGLVIAIKRNSVFITNNATPAARDMHGTGKDEPMSIPVLADFAFATIKRGRSP